MDICVTDSAETKELSRYINGNKVEKDNPSVNPIGWLQVSIFYILLT